MRGGRGGRGVGGSGTCRGNAPLGNFFGVIQKHMTDFRKMVETSMDLHLIDTGFSLQTLSS